MAVPDGKWYDAGNIDEMHDDLRGNYPQVVAVLLARPAMKKHFETCVVCQEIRLANEQAASPQNGMAYRELTRRRKNYILSTAQIAEILDLPADASILYMTVIGFQDVLSVTVCSPQYEIVPIGAGPRTVLVSLDEED